MNLSEQDTSAARTVDSPLDERYLPVRPTRRLTQRLFDLFGVVIGAVVVLPLIGLIAVAIKLDSRGPVFFRQTRVGLHRVPFRIWKFRKMRDDLPTQGPMLTLRYDTRMTRMGRILERTKLDELPQYFNVLAGQMSIVGPRPDVLRFVERYPRTWDRVLSVRPGIFGASQNHFRNESELYPEDVDDIEEFYVQHILPEMLELDARYAEHASLRIDLSLLVGGVLSSIFGTVTLRALITRRLHVFNAGVISALGVTTALAAYELVEKERAPGYVLWLGLGSALLAAVVCQVPSTLSTSLTPEDTRRIAFAALVRSSLLGVVVMLRDPDAVGTSVLVVDGTLFASGLMGFRLSSYLYRVNRVGPCSSSLRSRATWYAIAVAPVSIAMVITTEHGWSTWTGDDALAYIGLVVLAMLARPTLLLMSRPAGRMTQAGAPVLRELGSMLVSVGAGCGLLLLAAGVPENELLSVSEVAVDGVIFGVVLIGIGVWQAKLLRMLRSGAKPAAPRQRAIVIGDGPALASYLAAVDLMDGRSFDLVGVVTPRAHQHGSTISGHRIVGGTNGLAELLGATPVEQLVVVVESLDEPTIHSVIRLAERRGLQLVPVTLTVPYRLPDNGVDREKS